jgi:predicted nucleic acid-binding protein
MAARLGIQVVSIRPLWQAALTRALNSGVAVYDTLFVELAAQRDLKLATFDTELLEKFSRSRNDLVRFRGIESGRLTFQRADLNLCSGWLG